MTRPTIYELRNYIMRAGKREALIALFEAEFIEPQEALGSRIVGTFRNLDDPDRFVWMRAFTDMETRAAALDGFYTSDLWRARRDAANATMVDSDDVLQLKPVAGDALMNRRRSDEASTSLIVATTYFLRPHADGDFATVFARTVAPALAEARAAPFASFATEHAPNSYPRLPVRENETVFVTLTRFDSAPAHAARRDAIEAAARDQIARHIIKPTEMLRLAPTARSALR